MTAILLSKARQHAISLLGPPAAELFEPVPEADMIRALHDTAAQWNGPDDWLGDECNVVLALARIWLTLSSGEIAAKDVAADWLLERLPLSTGRCWKLRETSIWARPGMTWLSGPRHWPLSSVMPGTRSSGYAASRSTDRLPFRPAMDMPMTPDQIASFCLSLPGAREDLKWGSNRVFSVAGNKMFAILDFLGEDLAFKVDHDLFSATSTAPAFAPRPIWRERTGSA